MAMDSLERTEGESYGERGAWNTLLIQLDGSAAPTTDTPVSESTQAARSAPAQAEPDQRPSALRTLALPVLQQVPFSENLLW